MPKKNSRRQTLSSLDLETFLDEVSTENIKLTSRRNTMSSDDFLQNKINKLSLRDNENINPNLISNNNKSNGDLNDVSKITNVKLTVATTNSNDISESIAAKYHGVPVAKSNEQLVRDFCKLRRGLAAPQSHLTLLSIAKELQANSNYPLFSNQILHPEQYSHKSSTLEGKRAILVSLAPMLTDAEKQRQADGLSCELATQCKSVKIKGRGAGVYEYYDISTNIRVPHQEFEKRYYKFMESTKQFINNRLTLQGVPIISQTANDVTEKATETVNTCTRRTSSRLAPLQSQISVMNEFVSSVQVEVTTRSRSRRETLSPKTAKEMLVSCLDEDDEATNKVESLPKVRTNRRETLSPKTAKEMLVSCLDEDDEATNKVESLPKVRTNRRETLSPKTAKEMLVSCLDEDDEATNKVESLPKVRTNRRETLSPKTAKEMLVSCLDEDDEATNSAASLTNNQDNKIESIITVDIINTNKNNSNTTTTIKNNRRRQTLSPSSLREMLFNFDDVPAVPAVSNDVSTSLSPPTVTHLQNESITTTTTTNSLYLEEIKTNTNESPKYGFLTTVDDNNDEDQMILDQFNTELTALLANETIDIDTSSSSSSSSTSSTSPTEMMNISQSLEIEKQIMSPVLIGKRNRVITPVSNNNKFESTATSIIMNESSPITIQSMKINSNFEPTTPTTLPNFIAPKRPSFGRKSLTNNSNNSLLIVKTISENAEHHIEVEDDDEEEICKITDNSNSTNFINNITTNAVITTTTTTTNTVSLTSTLFSSAENLFNPIPIINTDAAIFFNSAPSSPLNTNKMDIMSKILQSPCPKGEAINVYVPISNKKISSTHSKNVQINESVFDTNNQLENQINIEKKELFTISSTFSRMNSHNNILTIDDVPMVNLISENRYSPVKLLNTSRSNTPLEDKEDSYDDNIILNSYNHNNIDKELSTISPVQANMTIDTDTTENVINSTNMESKAMARLYARFDVAKWKFNYEMTLVQLIMEANLSRC